MGRLRRWFNNLITLVLIRKDLRESEIWLDKLRELIKGPFSRSKIKNISVFYRSWLDSEGRTPLEYAVDLLEEAWEAEHEDN